MHSLQLAFGFLHFSFVAASSPRHPALERRQIDASFDWSTVIPSRELQYYDCYDGYKCARLQYRHPPGNCSSNGPSFGGTILINPGGPSGSGTQETIAMGHYLQSVVDGERHYEILGFDPRGVALSTPQANCYDSELSRIADAVLREGLPPAVTSDGLSWVYQASKGYGELCADFGDDSNMSTASVARDMLEIVDRVADERHNSSAAPDSGLPKLQYIGFSYGTVLGNTFASMFPERVGKMVLDGAVNIGDYTRGDWSENLNDAEIVVAHFYQTCFDAGDDCSLKQPTDTCADDIKRRVDDFIASLMESPISVVVDGRIRLVKSFLVQDAIRTCLYQPLQTFSTLSTILAQALDGDYELLLQYAEASFSLDDTCTTNRTGPFPQADFTWQDYTWSNEAGLGVLCGDSAYDTRERNESWAQGIVDFLDNQSPTTGESWARIPLACAGWEYQPKFTFRGPFGSTSLGKSQSHEDYPPKLLILSTRYDPVAPLVNAEGIQQQFPGSGLVVQESLGHCALLASKSNCTQEFVRAYFNKGEVPDGSATCQEDCSPSIPYEACSGFL
ncbi:hypothetical protein MBLNU230_g4832t1 [Neophaeotheca triangularis]